VFRELGGSHDASNLVLLCDGHHTQLHEGNVSITGRAPDELVFVRDGGRLVDSRARAKQQAAAQLAELARPASRFAEVVELEAATQALRQLGYKRRDAQRALAQVRAHVARARMFRHWCARCST
jgi:hypothetical protein